MNSPDGISPGGSTGDDSPYFDDSNTMDGYVLPQQGPSYSPLPYASKMEQGERYLSIQIVFENVSLIFGYPGTL